MQDDELDRLLRSRAIPMAQTGLAERIIHAAVTGGLLEKPVRQSLWNELMAMLVIPHPSVMVATGIILGLALGVQASDGLTVLQQDWSSFLDINEGGWL